MVVNIWHKYNHDDFTVTKHTTSLYLDGFVDSVFRSGGFQSGNTFIPWHSISFFNVELEPEPDIERDRR